MTASPAPIARHAGATLPWTVHRDYEGWFLNDANGEEVYRVSTCNADDGNDTEPKKDAEDLARILNAHGPLVEALEREARHTVRPRANGSWLCHRCWAKAKSETEIQHKASCSFSALTLAGRAL